MSKVKEESHKTKTRKVLKNLGLTPMKAVRLFNHLDSKDVEWMKTLYENGVSPSRRLSLLIKHLKARHDKSEKDAKKRKNEKKH